MKQIARNFKSVLVVGSDSSVARFSEVLKTEFVNEISFTNHADMKAVLSKESPALIVVAEDLSEQVAISLIDDLKQLKLNVNSAVLFIYSTGQEWSPTPFIDKGVIDFISIQAAPNLFRLKVKMLLEIQHQKNSIENSLKKVSQDAETEKEFLLENVLDAVVGVDEESKVVFWNKNAERIFGWSKTEMIGQDMTEYIIPPDLRAAHRAGLKKFVETGIAKIQNRRIEIPGLRRSGEVFAMELTVSAVSSASGYRFFSFLRDISVEKQRALIIQQSESHLRAVIDSSAGGFYGVDKDGVTTICNSAFLGILGFKSQEEALGKKLHDVIHHTKSDGKPYPKVECPIYQSAQTGISAHVYDESFYRLDGTSFPVEYWTVPLVYDGEVQGAVTTFIDISERKAAEVALRLAKEEAEKANRLKSAFLANMSHEIRTPLGAMLGFADLLRDRNLSESERANYTDILARNGDQLSFIINDILDISKVEAGHLTLEYRDVDAAHIAAEVVSLLQVKAKEKDLALELTFDDSTPITIVSDPTRIRQVLLNLVSNAIKFTQFGSVKIRGYGCKSALGRPSLCFEVVDTGIGIGKSHQEKIFEVFVQADGSMTRRFGGTGLGLALSRRLAHALGGEVSLIDSKERQGSKFLFTIEDQVEKRSNNGPSEYLRETKNFELTDDLLKNRKVLIVDDSPDNQQLIWRYLTKYGAIVDSAENGLIGYRKAIAGDFDIILMDIQMPEMDGYTATQKLREVGFRKPIIALTAHAMDEVRKKCLNIGCTDHLPKPINPNKLIQKIYELTNTELKN